jgi:hypothetical protein
LKAAVHVLKIVIINQIKVEEMDETGNIPRGYDNVWLVSLKGDLSVGAG